MKMDLSVIIPARNASETIARAVNSIPEDSGFTYEILIIENQSEDNTCEVISRLSEENPHIRVLIAENRGVSCARNKGLESAAGDWILFLDADDYLMEDCGSVLSRDISTAAADLYLYSFTAGKKRRYVLAKQGEQKRSDIECMRVQMLSDPTRYMQVWAKLFRRSLIETHSLRFNESLTVAEDSDFTLRYTRYCRSISLNHAMIYHYSVDSPSVMRTYDGTKAAAYLAAMRAGRKVVEGESADIQRAFNRYVLMHLNIVMVRDVFCLENPASFAEKLIQMRNLLQEDIFHAAVQQCRITECTSLRMSSILCLKLHWYLMAGFIYQVRAQQNRRREGTP